MAEYYFRKQVRWTKDLIVVHDRQLDGDAGHSAVEGELSLGQHPVQGQ
ncbi:MAG TPA: hypothetical protein VFK07_00580 [Candidatus Paceibacterota bacterium]|nr:hypothetical protein [Candidatus Paceibacterota bacterium]